jgi:hypothetical protein
MADTNPLEPRGLSMRSRSKVAGFLPILKTVDDLNVAAAHVDVEMSMGENWLASRWLPFARKSWRTN